MLFNGNSASPWDTARSPAVAPPSFIRLKSLSHPGVLPRLPKSRNERGLYRTAHGQLWPHVTINLMLQNPVFIGLPRQGHDSAAKYAYLDGQGNMKDKFEPTPVRRRSQWPQSSPNNRFFEPIVSVERFERVQKRLKPRTSHEGKRRYSSRCHDAWARGLLHCGECGHKMIVVHDGKRMLGGAAHDLPMAIAANARDAESPTIRLSRLSPSTFVEPRMTYAKTNTWTNTTMISTLSK